MTHTDRTSSTSTTTNGTHANGQVALPDWLTREQIRTLYGIDEGNLSVWHRKGCPALGGKTLRARPIPGDRSRDRARGSKIPRLEYWRGDLETIVAVPEFAETYQDSQGATWVSSEKAARLPHGFAPSSLTKWATKGCPFWGGKVPANDLPLVRKQTKRGIRFLRPRFFRLDDLEAVAAARRNAPAGAAGWIARRQAIKTFGINRDTLRTWAKEGCPALGGKKLRRKVERRMTPTGFRRFVDYDEQQLWQVKDYQPDVGNPDRRGGWMLYREVVDEFGYRSDRLSPWANDGCPYLDGRKLTTKTVVGTVPDKGSHSGVRRTELTLYARAEVEEIRRRMAESPYAPFVDAAGDTYLPNVTLGERYRVPKETLKNWRKAGKVRFVEEKRPGLRGHGVLHFYQEGDVRRMLGLPAKGMPAAVGAVAPQAEAVTVEEPPSRRKRRRGRPSKPMPEVTERNKKAVQAWFDDQAKPPDDRAFESIAAAARRFDMDRSTLSKLISAARRGGRRGGVK